MREICMSGSSGKSSATKYLTRNFGYVEVNSGRVLAKLLGLPPVPETSRPIFQEAAWRFIQDADGPARSAHALLRATSRSGADRVVIDGVRQLSTLRTLKAMAQVPVAVLFVHAAPPRGAYAAGGCARRRLTDAANISRNRSTAADGKIRIREQSNRARKSRRLSLIVPPSRIGAPPATRRTGFPAVCPSMQKKV
jgi:hypothetical protein